MEKILGKEAYTAASAATIEKLTLLREVIAESDKRKLEEKKATQDSCKK